MEKPTVGFTRALSFRFTMFSIKKKSIEKKRNEKKGIHVGQAGGEGRDTGE